MIWVVLLVVLPLIYIIYNRWSWIHSYWEFRCVPGPSPLPFIGNMLPVISGSRSFGDICLQWSREYSPSPLVGFYNFMTPYLMMNRTDYVKNVLVDDFARFTDKIKSQDCTKRSEDFLMMSSGAKWKMIRTKTSPIFSEEKVSGMFSCVKTCSEKTVNALEEKLQRDVANTDFIKLYTLDVAKRLVFGLELDGSSDFQRQYGKMANLSASCCRSKLKSLFSLKANDIPQISSVLQQHTDYFKNILQESLRKRKQEGIRKNDILQLLLELKENGQISIDKWSDPEDNFLMPDQNSIPSEPLEMTDELLTKQAMAFLTTGVEMTSSALTFTLLELCLNQQVMDHLVKEIDSVLNEHKVLTYEALRHMNYLDMCIKEAMRLHPVMSTITRHCTRNFTFDNGQQAAKGIMACVPVLAIHSDSKIYPEPTKFMPERFNTSPPSCTYLAFGEGPRMCIAKTLVMMEMKIFLAELLSKYEVKLSSSTKTNSVPVLTDNKNPIQSPQHPVYFQFKSR